MPSLAQIRTMVRASAPADWEDLEPGPWYLDGFATVNGQVETSYHPRLAVYRPDVSLRLAWGMRKSWGDSDDDGLRFDWHFPDPRMVLELVDVLWAGALVDRLVVVAVDGHRCLLPCPAEPIVVDSGQHRPDIVGETASAYDVAVARLVNSIGDGISEFDRYFRESGIVEIPNDGPPPALR